jgi:hypothetical protein
MVAGANVMILIFGEFHQLSAKILAFVLKITVMIIICAQIALIIV